MKIQRKVRNKARNVARIMLFEVLAVCVLVVLSTCLYVVVVQGVFTKHTFLSPLATYSATKHTTHIPANYASELAKEAASYQIQLKDITQDNDQIIARLSTGEEVLFSIKKPTAIQLSSLQLILSRLTIEGKGFTRIDLRFDHPVIQMK